MGSLFQAWGNGVILLFGASTGGCPRVGVTEKGRCIPIIWDGVRMVC